MFPSELPQKLKFKVVADQSRKVRNLVEMAGAHTQWTVPGAYEHLFELTTLATTPTHKQAYYTNMFETPGARSPGASLQKLNSATV